MKSLLLLGCIVLALTSTAARGHVPSQCIPLFEKAGHETQVVVRKGQETSHTAMEGLDQRYPDYDRLADMVAQLVGALTFYFTTLTAAIECVDSHPSIPQSVR